MFLSFYSDNVRTGSALLYGIHSTTSLYSSLSLQQALDFIGRRGQARPGLERQRRIRYADDLLQKELLPHIGVSPESHTKKAYFVGYMVHRLLLAGLRRRDTDDRDHYGNKV